MSHVIAAPEIMTAAATDLATIGETLNAAHMTAAPPTLAVLPAAADEVSVSIAHLFSGYGQEYQKLAGQAAGFPERFVQQLTASVGAYAGAEAANTALLQPLTAIADAVALPASLYDLLVSFVQNLLLFQLSVYNALVQLPFLGPLAQLFGLGLLIELFVLFWIFAVLGPLLMLTA